jgi:single-strand selective monofunctional uracil DNA glycosylase
MIDLSITLSEQLNAMDFSTAAAWVYNPTEYAADAHHAYLTNYARSKKRVLFLGMNPGPWGMAQTGVPFGEIAAVRDYLQIERPVRKPAREHPKRPIDGFACSRSEVSGRRLWGLMAERYPDNSQFAEEHFVMNYCPVAFMEESARNLTPDKLPAAIRGAITEVCNKHLESVISLLKPTFAVGVGAYAESALLNVLSSTGPIAVSRVLHPSPASPAANRDWAGTAKRQLIEAGVWSA